MSALEYRFSEKCVTEISCQSSSQKVDDMPHGLATDVERLIYLDYPNYPVEAHENLFLSIFHFDFLS